MSYAATLSEVCYQPTVIPVRKSAADRWGPWLAWLVMGIWLGGFGYGFRISLSILTAVGITLAVLSLRRPSVALLGLGLLCTLDSISRSYLMTGGLLRWNTLNYWLLIFMLMASPTLLRLKGVPSYLLLAYVTLMVMGLAFTPNRMRGILDLLNIGTAFGILVYFLRAKKDPRVWYWLGMVNGALGAVGGIVFYLQRGGLPKIDSNALAYFPLTALLSISIAFPFAAASREQKLLGLLAAMNFVWVFLTGSRQAMLVGAACALFLVSQLRGLGSRVTVVTAAALITVTGLSQFTDLQERSMHRVSKLFDSEYSMASRTSGRYDLMIGGWRIFRQYPLGVGTGGFPHAWAHLRDRRGLSDFVKGREFNCHSGWMKALTENGIPGFILFASYVGSFAIVGWNRRGNGLFKLGLLATCILSLAFIATEFQVKGTWFFASAITVLLLQRDSVHQRQEP